MSGTGRKCRYCGASNFVPMVVSSARTHNGPCDERCKTPGLLCLNCRVHTTTSQEEMEGKKT